MKYRREDIWSYYNINTMQVLAEVIRKLSDIES